MKETKEYLTGFQDATQLIEDQIYSAGTLDQVKEIIKRILATAIENKVETVKEELVL